MKHVKLFEEFINEASEEAIIFGDLYDDINNNIAQRNLDKIHKILSKYGTIEDLVTDTFDKANKVDQRKLLQLVGYR